MTKRIGESTGLPQSTGGPPSPPGPPPPFQPASYIFVLNQFHIDNTRSVDQDTDTVSFAVKIGQQMMGDPQIKHMGDVDNGDHPVNLQFGPFLIDNPATPVVMNFAIINNGHAAQKDLDNALVQAGASIAALAIGGASGWVVIAKKIIEFLGGIIFADCDGPVAGDQIEFTGDSLHAQTARFNTLTETRNYPGTDSSTGCGSNSMYSVTWSVLRVPPDPSHAIFVGRPAVT